MYLDEPCDASTVRGQCRPMSAVKELGAGGRAGAADSSCLIPPSRGRIVASRNGKSERRTRPAWAGCVALVCGAFRSKGRAQPRPPCGVRAPWPVSSAGQGHEAGHRWHRGRRGPIVERPVLFRTSPFAGAHRQPAHLDDALHLRTGAAAPKSYPVHRRQAERPRTVRATTRSRRADAPAAQLAPSAQRLRPRRSFRRRGHPVTARDRNSSAINANGRAPPADPTVEALAALTPIRRHRRSRPPPVRRQPYVGPEPDGQRLHRDLLPRHADKLVSGPSPPQVLGPSAGGAAARTMGKRPGSRAVAKALSQHEAEATAT